ncbi:hypothetical protein [Corynebacterium sp. A21]|uniref:hypothetical protein n=1 Tax=Corynebacterium sp. A21 TaxID=3457318 RepID=UPI003FD47E07
MKRGILPVLLVALCLSACTIPPEETAEPTRVTLTESGSPSVVRPSPSLPATVPAPSAASISTGELQPLIDAAVATYGGTAALVVSDGSTEIMAGPDAPAAAWSTIKVPLALAALRVNAGVFQTAVSAIQSSDNEAATALWVSLGDSVTAGTAVEQVLAEGGSPVPVTTEVTRPGFSSFGQTAWTTAQQARFAAGLPCIDGGEQLLSLMSGIIPEQAVGLGRLPGARFKGGWGPDPQGAYDLRQFGLVTGPLGDLAVALTVSPGSGSFADAQAMADQIATGLAKMLINLPAASCT